MARTPRNHPNRAARTLQATIALTIAAAPALSPAGAGAQLALLPASNYSVRSICPLPLPGSASCLAKELLPLSAQARSRRRPIARVSSSALQQASAAAGSYGLRPQDLHSAYNLPLNAASRQTVAIVDAFDDPHIEADLATYSREFSLPECTSSNGCFTKINSAGAGAPLPAESGEWSFEVALDVETVHAVCQNCRILLVEAESNSDAALAAAENRAVLAGANEVTNSFGGPEPLQDSEAFNHPGTVITAAAGDNGYLGWDGWNESERGYVDYPASSPHVIAVGATRLNLASNGERLSESVWNDGVGATGGGCSAHFAAPAWQLALANWSAVGCSSQRSVSDIAAVGDPYTGLAVYDSTPWNGYTLGWVTAGGTSLASPLVAAAFALAGGSGGVAYPAQSLYRNAAADPALFHDIAGGSNGQCTKPLGPEGQAGCTEAEEAASCQGRLSCLAGTGYDGPSGLGSPTGLASFSANPGTVESAPAQSTQGTPAPSGSSTGGGPGAAAPKEAGASPPPAAESQQQPKRAANPESTGSGSAEVPRLAHLRMLRHARAHAGGQSLHRSQFALAFNLTVASPVELQIQRICPARPAAAGPCGRARGARRGGRRTSLTLSIAARKGRNAWRLPATRSLAVGHYRLTLTPAGGSPETLLINVA